MPITKIQDFQVVHDASLPVMGKGTRTEIKDIVDAVDANFDGPLRMQANAVPNNLVYFSSSTRPQSDGASITVPPTNGSVPQVANSTVNFATKAAGPGVFEINWPVSPVNNRYYRVGFTLLGDGRIKGVFSLIDSVTYPGTLENPGKLFAKGTLPIGYMDLRYDSSSGAYRTALSATSVIENSGIFRFGSGSYRVDDQGANELLERMKDHFSSGIYQFMTPYVIEQDVEALKDVSSTCTYSLTDGVLNFNPGNFLLTSQLLDADFLNDEVIPSQVCVDAYWHVADPNATYEVSMNGGLTFNPVTMNRTSESDGYRGTAPVSAGQAEITTITFSQPGTFYDVATNIKRIALRSFYNSLVSTRWFWFRVSDGLNTQPDPTVAGEKSVPVTILRGDTAALIAKKFEAAVLSTGLFFASTSGAVVTVTHKMAGPVSDAVIQFSAASTSVVRQGAGTQAIVSNLPTETDSIEIAPFNPGSPERFSYLSFLFDLSSSSVINAVVFNLQKVGTPLGAFRVAIIRAQSAAPFLPSLNSADTVVFSDLIQTSDIPTGGGSWTMEVPLSATALKPGKYHVAIIPDFDYFSSYVSGSSFLRMSVRKAASAGATFPTFGYDGENWTSYTNIGVTFLVRGLPLSLRLKITASVASSLKAIGVHYSPGGSVVSAKLEQEFFSFTGNTYSFYISKFLPNAATLTVNWIGTGKQYVWPDFQVDGQYVNFPAGTFDTGQPVTLRMDQSAAPAVDTSDANASKIAELSQQLLSLTGLSQSAVCSIRPSGTHIDSGLFKIIDGYTVLSNSTAMVSAGTITIPYNGWYEFSGGVGFAPNAVGYRDAFVVFSPNPPGVPSGTPSLFSFPAPANPAGVVSKVALSGAVYLTAGTTIQIAAFQNSGGPLAYSDGLITIKKIQGP